ncbi:hypothetical protein [Rothia aeria]|jgi:hypothetical protein|uniref:hypothetical protein n=1 Tax=Rothia aeria TaxID=172042 RepID=UPI00244C303D|nr:hypothetical protein [Rothia aeria]
MSDKSMKMTMMTEQFEKGDSGETVEGITLIVDGVVKDVTDILKETKGYDSTLDLIQDAIVRGLAEIRES